MPDPVLLVRNARLYVPEDRGMADLLLAGGRIVAIAPRIEPGRGLEVVALDAAGRLAVPGFVDSLVHVSGGGGEGGFGTRTPALQPADAVAAGVTTLVGALGTDDVTRSHADLLASCRALAPSSACHWACTPGWVLMALVTASSMGAGKVCACAPPTTARPDTRAATAREIAPTLMVPPPPQSGCHARRWCPWASSH